MAFGTGLHPTTRLCLAALEPLADDGRLAGARVLDVGCGSGILAIAAVRLGAAAALGVDTDPIAVEATSANARRNRLGRRIRAREGSLPSGEPPFDVVLANLIAGVLVPLAGALRDELRPGGTLLASGIFIDREAEVGDAFEAAGLELTGRRAEGEWVAPRGAGGHDRRPLVRSAAMPANLVPGPARHPHRPGDRLFLPSILLPFALRTRRARSTPTAGSCARCCGRSRTGRSIIGAGLALTGLGLVLVLGPSHAPAAVAARRARDLLRRTSPSRSSSSARTCVGSSASRRPPMTRSGRSGHAPALRRRT